MHIAFTYQQKLALQDGSMVFYHEANLPIGDVFHFITNVPGVQLERYFAFLANNSDFQVSDLEAFGRILRCEKGKMTDLEIGLFLLNRLW